MRVFALRLVFGSFLIGVVLLSVYLDFIYKQTLAVLILATIFSTLCFFEFAKLVKQRGFQIPLFIPMLILCASYFVPHMELAFFFVLCVYILFLRTSVESSVFCVAGFFYCGLLKFAVIAGQLDIVKPLQHYFYLFLFLVCKGNDTFAYFGGKLFGRHKILPNISPMKTWEGTVFGIIAGTIGGYLVLNFTGLAGKYSSQTLALILFSFAATILGSVGDALKSVLKRWAGVKNSGVIFSDMGGFIDVCDSFLVTAPFVYIALSLA